MTQELDITGISALAQQIMASARTAPKSCGLDSLVLKAIYDEPTMERIAVAMDRIFAKTGRALFQRDAGNLRNSSALILFAIGNKAIGLNCGACGMNCNELTERCRMPRPDTEFGGPLCCFKSMDLGIALGSAAKMAAILGVDNRLMYSIGVAARAEGIIDGECVIAMPMSLKGKNIYFDRRP